jgi:translation initiation factor 5B
MQLVEKEEVLPGMPFEIYKNNLKELKEKFSKEISEKIKTKSYGIIAKADSLGSLEALLYLLENQKIPVVKVGIGNINKSDVISAKANIDINELDAIIVGFNVVVEEDATELIKDQGKKIKVITEEVVYKLIESLMDWRLEKQKAIEKKRLMELTTICKIRILHQYVFRNTSPAIFGVKVEGGKLKQQIHFIDEKGEKVGKIKNIESEKKSVQEANEGMEVAISMPGVNFERAMKDKNVLYSDLGESQFRNFKKNKDLLSGSEMKVLQEIAEIKRKVKADWGM